MRNIQIAAFRGRDPDNPSDRKHPLEAIKKEVEF